MCWCPTPDCKFMFEYNKGDPIEFLSWLLNSLHLTLNGTKSATSSIIYKTFQGRMKIYTRKIPPVDVVNFLKIFYDSNSILILEKNFG